MDEPAQPVDTGSTHRFATRFGTTTHHQVADPIADRLRWPLDEVASGHFTDEATDVDRLREFDRRIASQGMRKGEVASGSRLTSRARLRR
ncbi:hypothetical protein GCM10022140_47550 [Rhodococcus aetherivorans]